MNSSWTPNPCPPQLTPQERGLPLKKTAVFEWRKMQSWTVYRRSYQLRIRGGTRLWNQRPQTTHERPIERRKAPHLMTLSAGRGTPRKRNGAPKFPCKFRHSETSSPVQMQYRPRAPKDLSLLKLRPSSKKWIRNTKTCLWRGRNCLPKYKCIVKKASRPKMRRVPESLQNEKKWRRGSVPLICRQHQMKTPSCSLEMLVAKKVTNNKFWGKGECMNLVDCVILRSEIREDC